MSTTESTQPDQGLADFWAVYDKHYDEIRASLQESLDVIPEMAALLKDVGEEETERQSGASRELLRQAVATGEWEPYLTNLRGMGRLYADLGLSFEAWFKLSTSFRTQLLPHLLSAYRDEADRQLGALRALGGFVDRGLSAIGEAYLQRQQAIIASQHEAIEELSTPVLELREGLLLQPVIGVLDSTRARQLTESMLEAIRTYRGRVVVVDITGVPEVDSEVANRLLQAARAAGLMGASAIITGLSAGVAQALVTLGVDLGRLRTLGSLRDGIDEANRILGYRIERTAPLLRDPAVAPGPRS